MSSVWIKVWADLWGNKTRTFLAVSSIAAGVFAVGAIFGMADLMSNGMNASHQASTPSHIQMYLTGYIDRNTAARLEKIAGVEEIEVLNTASVRYRVAPEAEWETSMLVMRDDYQAQQFDIYQLKAGDWPEQKHFGIERLSSQFYGIDIGDEVIFEVNDRAKKFTVNGKVRHPFVPPPQFGGEAVFFADAEGMTQFDVPKGEFAQMLVRVAPYSLDLAKEVGTEIKGRLSKDRIGVAATFYQDPEKHWGGFFMDGFNLVLKVLAIVSLGASVVLVLNTLTAIITQQTDQIGVIKAIGGTTGTIIKLYLAVVLVYGLLALFVALPLGAFIAFSISKGFLNLFNIDYEVFQVSRQAITFQVLAAILVPLLAALWPVLSGATITVREAIASYGLGGDFGNSKLDRLVERVAQKILSAPYAIAIGNMFRRKGRLIFTQVALITAGAMVLMVMSLSASINFSLDNETARNDYDTIVFFEDEERIDRVVALAQSLPDVETAEVRFSHSASILRQGQRASEAGIGTQLVGLPNSSDMFQPIVVAGRWLLPEDGRAIVIYEKTAEDNNINLGDTVTLDLNQQGKSDWMVVGLYTQIFSGFGSFDSIYANRDAVFQTIGTYNRGSGLYVRTHSHDEESVNKITEQLKMVYDAENIKVNSTQTALEIRQQADSTFAISISMLFSMAVIVAVVGGVGLMGALSISVVERTREIGVMRAIGARSLTIMGMFMTEGVLQGFFSWFIVVPLSFILARPMADALGQVMFSANLDYRYNLKAVLVWLAIVLIIAMLASIIPARNATRISVRDSLAYQ